MVFGTGRALALGLCSRLLVPAPDAADWTDNAACATCHPVIAAQWRGSQHHTSFSDDAFQTAHAIEPSAFCRGCHAPQRSPSLVDPSAAANLGVACVTCHLEENAAIAGPGPESAAPHPVVRQASFTTADACSRCHEFEFPDSGLRDEPAFMQTTVREHRESRFADRSCASCHMPRVDGVRSHAFGASRDVRMLKRSLHIQATRVPDGVVLILRAADVGHAVPTGDLLRRLEVGASMEGGPATRRFLARHFGRLEQAYGLVVLGERFDDRVPADGSPRVVRLDLPGASESPVRWWVRYQRVAHQRTFDEADALLDADIELSSGTLPPLESTSQ